ncbi:DNA repair and recombination protein pif1 [Cordyceps fumosorosea ARSEF 2679]|uniref:ATP-dependent DNA helicase PIF1 n=1 Tax=Cordyceps fumosorosea (strain ARSEF 2679) TaxID=1081104 RepID=A0A168CGZ8_CORFA|nr:DNA repair and recombination protein pif1 [Cordyceps fumosorosea ARSEF 2679]OAA71365.1 DNA repair and recombination protein pif1 [Cordyceps fumosorosea ARSEF 2679]
MFAKANKTYEAKQPAPSQQTARRELAEQLFPPSSSPNQPPVDIREQFKRRAPPRFLPSSPSTARPSRPQLSEKLTRDGGATNGSGAGRGSLAGLYHNNHASFKDNVIDLTKDDVQAARPPPVVFTLDEFSDDDELDLDFKVPSAVSPSKVTSISKVTVAKENQPPISSGQAIPWSSSPASHFLPPQQHRTESNLSTGSSGSLKRDSPEHDDDCFEMPAPVLKAKKRTLPSDWSRRTAPEGQSLQGRPETPDAKAKVQGLWDQSASAIKEQRKLLKNQRNAKQEEADAAARAPAMEHLPPAESTTAIPRSGPIALSNEQRHVLDLVVEQGQSVFFTGPAGTGKSVLMRAIITALQTKHGRTSERVAVTASTGLAACNIGGITLHSFAGIGLGKDVASALVKKVRRNPKAKNRWLKTKVLIIDEISMVDGDLFDKLSQIGRTVRNNGRPWGGIQLVITGDFFQLPPVPDDSKVASKFAFDAATWNTSIDHTIGLTQVFRQRDPEFARMLNEMRLGKISDETVAAFKALERPLKFDDGVDLAELYPLRAQVEGSNEKRLRDLPGEIHRFGALDTGDKDIKDRLLANVMAPKSIDLKLDAQVMLIKNLDSTLVNGSLGRVIGFSDEKTFSMQGGATTSDPEMDTSLSKARKKLSSFSRDSDCMSSSTTKYPIVQFISAHGEPRVILCQPEEWKVELPNGEVQAKRTQLPLILAWALSIHKAQGQTLERVTVNLGRIFEKGQAYVALSRATSQEGLRVIGFDRSKVMAHARVVEFYNKLYSAEQAGATPGVRRSGAAGILDFVAARRGT